MNSRFAFQVRFTLVHSTKHKGKFAIYDTERKNIAFNNGEEMYNRKRMDGLSYRKAEELCERWNLACNGYCGRCQRRIVDITDRHGKRTEKHKHVYRDVHYWLVCYECRDDDE